MKTSSRIAAIVAFVGGVALAAGVGAIAHNAGGMSLHHGGPVSAEEVASHVDMLLQHVYIEVDATDAQKTQLEAIVKQAVTDLLPLRDQVHSAHADALAVFTQDTIDRNAIETLRAEHMRTAEQASQRIAQAIADVAQVLTPAQRKKLAAHMALHQAEHQG
jgi:periplasmic protein CpxP/Spy